MLLNLSYKTIMKVKNNPTNNEREEIIYPENSFPNPSVLINVSTTQIKIITNWEVVKKR